MVEFQGSESNTNLPRTTKFGQWLLGQVAFACFRGTKDSFGPVLGPIESFFGRLEEVVDHGDPLLQWSPLGQRDRS